MPLDSAERQYPGSVAAPSASVSSLARPRRSRRVMAAVAVYVAHLLACIIGFWSAVGEESGGFKPVGKYAGGGFLRAFPTTAQALKIDLADRENGVLLIQAVNGQPVCQGGRETCRGAWASQFIDTHPGAVNHFSPMEISRILHPAAITPIS